MEEVRFCRCMYKRQHVSQRDILRSTLVAEVNVIRINAGCSWSGFREIDFRCGIFSFGHDGRCDMRLRSVSRGCPGHADVRSGRGAAAEDMYRSYGCRLFLLESRRARRGDVRAAQVVRDHAGWGVCVAWVVLVENESDLLCAPPPAGGGAASPSALRS